MCYLIYLFFFFSPKMSAYSPKERLFSLSTNFSDYCSNLRVLLPLANQGDTQYYLAYLHACRQIYFIIGLYVLYLYGNKNAECCISFSLYELSSSFWMEIRDQ